MKIKISYFFKHLQEEEEETTGKMFLFYSIVDLITQYLQNENDECT